ncbi:MAG: pyridoxal phosphate-dependent aminotransferase family protein [Chitinophagaceae bacterium]|nr:pyridoxal phosphate-dependent aminotransferase family protein [Chitinophagaceae bacterium]
MEVVVKDPFTGELRNMLMFASNNYLGLANHPHVKYRVSKAIDEFGCGIGGPPLLNGYIKLIQETEERLAALKGKDAAILFSSGFMANLGVITALAEQNDVVLYDELSHASFHDGIRLTRATSVAFSHNNIEHLEKLLGEYHAINTPNIFVCAEGVYSMDGNIGRIDLMATLCKKLGPYSLWMMHGTEFLGKNGSGTASLLGCSKNVDVNMGTFSKVFATCGGFIAALLSWWTICATMPGLYFSASIPPPVAATVLGGLDVMEKEPWQNTIIGKRKICDRRVI